MSKSLFTLAAGWLFVLGLSAQAAPQIQERGQFSDLASSPVWFNKQLLLPQAGQIQSWNPINEQWLSFGALSDCQPGATLANREQLLVACQTNPRLLVLNSFGQTLETFPRPLEEDGLSKTAADAGTRADLTGVTAMVDDARGGTYIAASLSDGITLQSRGKGQIYYLSPSRSFIKPVATGLNYPAGLALSPDGKSLFVSEGLTRQVLRYDVDRTSLANPQVVLQVEQVHTPSAQASEAPRPGALAINSKGHLYTALNGDGVILVSSQSGKKLAELPVPLPYIKGFSFGKSDRTLYINANDSSGRDQSVLYEMRL